MISGRGKGKNSVQVSAHFRNWVVNKIVTVSSYREQQQYLSLSRCYEDKNIDHETIGSASERP